MDAATARHVFRNELRRPVRVERLTAATASSIEGRIAIMRPPSGCFPDCGWAALMKQRATWPCTGGVIDPLRGMIIMPSHPIKTLLILLGSIAFSVSTALSTVPAVAQEDSWVGDISS